MKLFKYFSEGAYEVDGLNLSIVLVIPHAYNILTYNLAIFTRSRDYQLSLLTKETLLHLCLTKKKKKQTLA